LETNVNNLSKARFGVKGESFFLLVVRGSR